MPYLGLVLALFAGSPQPAPAPTDVVAAADDEVGDKILLKTKIKRDGKKEIAHPGQMAETGSEMILVLKQGEHTHEVGVLVEKTGKGFTADVVYSYDGKKVLSKKVKVGKKKWVKIKSGKHVVQVYVDPDAGRADEVDLPGGNNPLDGV